MKKFKQIFYPIYLILALSVFFFSLKAMVVSNPVKDENVVKNPSWFSWVLLLASTLMITEIIIENIQLRRLRIRAERSEEEILRLKVKLFDQSDKKAEKGEPEKDNP